MNTTLRESSELPKLNTVSFSGSRMDVARFVTKVLLLSRDVSPSITITVRGSSEDCSATFVIDESLVDTVKNLEPSSSLTLTIT